MDTTDAELAAVLTALAGVRTGDPFVVLGGSDLVRRALLAGSAGQQAEPGEAAQVVVAVASYDVPSGVATLLPGGRLVSMAADRGAAQRTAELHGLHLRHVEPVGRRVAWSATRPATTQPTNAERT